VVLTALFGQEINTGMPTQSHDAVTIRMARNNVQRAHANGARCAKDSQIHHVKK
jgi:hypothetical protein